MWRLFRRIGPAIRQQESSPKDITITLESTRAGASCPLCGRVSRHRHSSYTRRLMDLPADGRTVNILLLVRRFERNRYSVPTCCIGQMVRAEVYADRLELYCEPAFRTPEASRRVVFACSFSPC